LESLIVPDFLPVFEKFRAKRFNFLWQDSRNVFTAGEFHHCDGRANTLTLILDTEGNVFGGFTPVKWESHVWNRKQGKETNCLKSDNNLRSFIFTLRNPHCVPPRNPPVLRRSQS
jgi:hypothetical protein